MAGAEQVFVLGGGAELEPVFAALGRAELPAPKKIASAGDLEESRDAGAIVLCLDALPERIAPFAAWIVIAREPTPEGMAAAFGAGAMDYVPLRAPAHVAHAASRELARTRATWQAQQEMARARAISARTTAMYQQRALQMEIIRQQNEDLDRLAKDLARSKKIEEDRAREIEAAARLKGEFLANFSHEIRTPLNGILGYCDLLAREEGSRLTPHGRRDLNLIKTNAKTLLALINDILDLSKIESGNVDIVSEPVEMTSLVDECAATVREMLKGKPVELTTRVASDAAIFTSDSLKMRQIMLNLLSNAAKFTETGEIVVDVAREGDAAVIVVEDTGAGMPADKLPFIFEKFRQVDSSTTRKVGGTGLGLAIVRELSRLLGGHVDVWSELGRGSRFTVRFPSMFAGGAPQATRPQPLERHENAPQPERAATPASNLVLVVDDDPPTRQLLRDELEREGFTVLLATDGVEALRVLGEHRPAAVVLDLHLPRLDGWSVLSRIKSDPALCQTPVVLISVEEARARGFALGASEFLVKPFEPDRLVSLVTQLVSPLFGEVLIVDDDANMREVISRNLRRVGFATAEARSGQEALIRMRATKPSLLILDLVMPGMDGFEVLRSVRNERLDVQVIVLTGKTLTSDEESTLNQGITSILHKDSDAISNVIAETKRVVMRWQKAAASRTHRVLYVEDSAQNRDLVRRYLRGVYDLFEAEDGEEALERVAQHAPHLILMDLSLPRLDGYETTRRLKADAKFAGIPVIAVTAHAAREDEQRARAAGCIEYLTKPVTRDDLLAAIARHLPGNA